MSAVSCVSGGVADAVGVKNSLSHTTELQSSLIVGVAVVAVQLVIPDPDIGPTRPVPQLDVTDGTSEAVDVVVEGQ